MLRQTFNTLQRTDGGDLRKHTADRLVKATSTSAYRATFGKVSVCQSKQRTIKMVRYVLELLSAGKAKIAIMLMLRLYQRSPGVLSRECLENRTIEATRSIESCLHVHENKPCLHEEGKA